VNVQAQPEVYRSDDPLPVHDPWVATIAWLMDGVIPLGRFSIGLDPLLGLIPGIGDILGAAISMLIVVRAVQMGIPRIAVARMMTNIAIDTLVGAIPLAGDAFDFAFRANLKNLRIYEEALLSRRSSTARQWWFFFALFAGIAAVIGGFVYLVVLLIRQVG
jgi:Domain of unknown function (DUF4112)